MAPVGFVVVFWDEGVDFGELIPSEIALHGDLKWIVGRLFLRQVPLEHFALRFSCFATVYRRCV